MGEQEEKRAEVTKSTEVSPGTNLVFLAPSYGVGTRRQFPARGTRGCAGTSGQGAGDGGVFFGCRAVSCCRCRTASSQQHFPTSQQRHSPKGLRGAQMAAAPRVQVCSAAVGVPPAAPGVPGDFSWSRRQHAAASQSSDPGQHGAELQTH